MYTVQLGMEDRQRHWSLRSHSSRFPLSRRYISWNLLKSSYPRDIRNSSWNHLQVNRIRQDTRCKRWSCSRRKYLNRFPLDKRRSWWIYWRPTNTFPRGNRCRLWNPQLPNRNPPCSSDIGSSRIPSRSRLDTPRNRHHSRGRFRLDIRSCSQWSPLPSKFHSDTRCSCWSRSCWRRYRPSRRCRS